jgi:integrase/recombinase XerD
MKDDEYAPSSIRLKKVAVSQFYERTAEATNMGLEVPDAVRDNEGDVRNPAEDLSLDWNYMKKGSLKDQNTTEKFVYLEPDEVDALKEHVRPPELRNELIVEILYRTGMRRSELSRLKPESVTFYDGYIQFEVNDVKGNKERTVWSKNGIRTLLDVWMNVERETVYRADESDFLFPTQKSDRITPDMITNMVAEAADDAGLQEVLYIDKNGNEKRRIGAHALRHSYANRMITGEDSLDLARLQDLMGHESIDVTREYLDFKDKQKRVAALACW